MRDFTSDDQDAVRALVLDGMRERWGDAYDDSFNPDLDDIWSEHVVLGADVVVHEQGDGRGRRIVAVGMLLPEPDGRGRIRRVSVDRDHRQLGLGRAVVDELIARARRRQMVEVLVRADTPWTSALALYRSCGFTCVGQDDTDTLFSLKL